ncbi:prostaglandin reductase 1-like [Culicoides brevitarsis]|uniref:prostaglandin reductase 1-like n=1 Tax=Culicoides brevitarsis TaxID=469753 RepID=UPI00307B78B0
MIRRFFATTANMVKARTWVKANEWNGLPKIADFKLVEEELPALKPNEVLVESEFLSVDPYQWAYKVNPGSVMIGGQVGKVMESKNDNFPVGSFVYGHFGWRSHTVFTPDASGGSFGDAYALPDFKSLPRSLALGVLGMPGNTAYFGFLEICGPVKSGETLVVNAAAGAVGSLVGQIGKLKGMKVIGIAGSDKKCQWLTNELGFDHAINYKTQDVKKELARVADKGIDCFFDNVGGEQASWVINLMNDRGRISVCGSISTYDNITTGTVTKVPAPQPMFVFKQLKMEGFVVTRWSDRWMEGIHQMGEWVKEGKIKYHETVTEGFDNMPKAFVAMLTGDSTGKAVVKA